jgi:putative transposase
MSSTLQRFYDAGYLHFITFSCYQRRPLLGDARRRDLFLTILEQTRQAYRLVILGYVVMPEHVHLLIGEPDRANPSVVIQSVKQRVAQTVIEAWRTQHPGAWPWRDSSGECHFWQRRFYDFVVWTDKKVTEKLDYMHENPVERGLVAKTEDWTWSSFRHYEFDEAGPVLVNERVPAKLGTRERQTWGGGQKLAG